MQNAPDSGLFPLPDYVGPVEIPRAQEVQQQKSGYDFTIEITDLQTLASPLGVIAVCLMLYTRLVRGEPVNPFKWVGWTRKGPRKGP